MRSGLVGGVVSTFDPTADAGHVLQNIDGEQIVDILRRIAEEA